MAIHMYTDDLFWGLIVALHLMSYGESPPIISGGRPWVPGHDIPRVSWIVSGHDSGMI